MDELQDHAAAAPDSPRSERDADQINKTFGGIVRRRRQRAGMTLDQLAMASQVSRAMLSSVERGEKSPTLTVLAGIAHGLDVTMSQLMGEEADTSVATVIRKNQRLVFHDRITGIERHLLSPTHEASGIELIEHLLPPRQEFASVHTPGHDTDKYVIVRSGQLAVELGDTTYRLDPEDAMYFQANSNYRFFNYGTDDCRYYVFIVHKNILRQ